MTADSDFSLRVPPSREIARPVSITPQKDDLKDHSSGKGGKRRRKESEAGLDDWPDEAAEPDEAKGEPAVPAGEKQKEDLHEVDFLA